MTEEIEKAKRVAREAVEFHIAGVRHHRQALRDAREFEIALEKLSISPGVKKGEEFHE